MRLSEDQHENRRNTPASSLIIGLIIEKPWSLLCAPEVYVRMADEMASSPFFQ
jgi:hypothetical protein